MRIVNALSLLLVFGCYVPIVLAAGAKVVISSPVEGAKISPTSKIEVVFEVAPGAKGDHVHLYVDDKKNTVMLRTLKGSHTLEPLAPGKHGICVMLVHKGHTEVGAQDCVMFRVE